MATAIAGGVLALGQCAWIRVNHWALPASGHIEDADGGSRRGVLAYGVAIATGGAVVAARILGAQ